MGSFPRGSVKGFLLDITGVLYNSAPGGGAVIPGSVEAVRRFFLPIDTHSLTLLFRLYAENKVRFVSNESTSTPAKLLEKLQRLGYDIDVAHLFTPAPVAAAYVKKHNLRPHLLVHQGTVFRGINEH